MGFPKRYFSIFAKALLDVGLIVVGFQAAYLLQNLYRGGDFPIEEILFRLRISFVYAAIFVVVAQKLTLYGNQASLFNIQEKAGLLRALFVTSIFFLACNSMFHFSRSNFDLLITTLVLLVLLSIYRHFLYRRNHKKYLQGKYERKVLIYGAGDTGKMLFKKMYFMEGGDFSLLGFLDDTIPSGTELTIQRSRSKARPFYAKVLGGFNDLPALVKTLKIYQIIIAMPSVARSRISEIIQACRENNVRYAFVPDLYDLRLEQVDTRNIGDIPLLKKREYQADFLYHFFKRIFDLSLGGILFLFTAPFFPLIALLVKWGSKGPVFFKQKRVGLNGKLFTMYKFRTMSTDTPEYMSSPSSNRPSLYISKIGSFLRDTNLDELPQLWSIVTGEMSLVGPRPEMPFHVEKYDAVQKDRLSVKPGLTGFWQISPDRDKEIHDNIDYDLYFINHRTFFGDLVLVIETFLLTVMAVTRKTYFFCSRAYPKRFLGSPQNKESSSQAPV